MILKPTPFEDCFLIEHDPIPDCRGVFVKLYHEDTFAKFGLSFELKEEFYSISNARVIRGMHFQIPPHEPIKIVSCLEGEVLDVLLDLRKNKETYGQSFSCTLKPEKPESLYIPPGIAHGFLSIKENSLTHYILTSAYEVKSDKGILWNSFDFIWPEKDPILSERDLSFPKLIDFSSPFKE